MHRDDAGTEADGADGEDEGDVAGGLVPHLREVSFRKLGLGLGPRSRMPCATPR